MAGRDDESARAAFGAKLDRILREKGWNQSDLARQASRHLPEGKKFRRDNVSNYVTGRALPSPLSLDAMARALRMRPEDLLPERAATDRAPDTPIGLSDAGGGQANLRLDVRLPWDVALKVLDLVNTSRDDPA